MKMSKNYSDLALAIHIHSPSVVASSINIFASVLLHCYYSSETYSIATCFL